ncbi:cytochrome b/b6 domain-containing protein [Microbacterium sp. NPDC058342]|uniref:cytochrome b/b6 domain-containing protein n=1 Tax=Microbacterium sp. NPDC058342 TaxID=3346454 RepID=UPI00364E181A
MAERMLRRGLPRVKGGEPWPPAAESPAPPAPAEVASSARDLAEDTGPSREEAVPSAASGARDTASAPVPAASVTPTVPATLRRGLPRVAGGEPWPPASAAASPVAASSVRDLAESTDASRGEVAPSTVSRAVDAQPAEPGTPRAVPAGGGGGPALRRGLPRVAGGEPWPPAGVASSSAPVLTESTDAPREQAVLPTASGAVAARPAAPAAIDVSTPLPFTRTVWPGTAPRHAAQPEREPSKRRPTWPQAIGGLLGLAALGLVAVAGVFLVRTFLSLPFMQDFLVTYPGEYHVDVEPGFSPWVGWQHFFNMFLMVLIIRSGLRVRSEKRPTVFWTPRRNGKGKGKISLTLWFHQALDLLWIINGVVFVVLLFVTGHWARLVPTSWEVIPNALSAGLQYISLDWPTDNGWVNYNSLQQLAYFATVFIAAPLAVVTGFRMSGLWPKKAERLSRAYPVEWARAVHFPVMLYFVAFIIVHVALVFLTGALRNLNHMFAAQGSADGMEYAANWTGFWVFVVAMVVIAGGWFAARPLVLAPIAKLFGQVSGR